MEEEKELIFQGKPYKLKKINLKVQNNTVELLDKIKTIQNPESVKEVHEAIQARRKEYLAEVDKINAMDIPENMKDYFKSTEGNLCITDEKKIKSDFISEVESVEFYKRFVTEFLEDGETIDFTSDDFDFSEFSNFVVDVLIEFKKKKMPRMS